MMKMFPFYVEFQTNPLISDIELAVKYISSSRYQWPSINKKLSQMLSLLSLLFSSTPEYIHRDRMVRNNGYHMPTVIIGYTFDVSVNWRTDDPNAASLGICNPEWIPRFTDDDPNHQEQVKAATKILESIAKDRGKIGSVQSKRYPLSVVKIYNVRIIGVYSPMIYHHHLYRLKLLTIFQISGYCFIESSKLASISRSFCRDLMGVA